MNNELKAYSVLTGDMFVQTEHKSKLKYILDMKFSTAHIRIRPEVVARPRSSWLSSCLDEEIRNKVSADTRLDGIPWLPTPLHAIDAATQTYFTKHKLVRDDGATIHPWHIVAWSQKVAKTHNAFKVLAKKDGSSGWILLPLTPSELKQLPQAAAAQQASLNAKAEASRRDRDASLAKLTALQAQQESAALQQALKFTAGADDLSKRSTTSPRVQQQRVPTHRTTRSSTAPRQRNSVDEDAKKRLGSSRTSSFASSISSLSHSRPRSALLGPKISSTSLTSRCLPIPSPSCT